MEPFCFRLEKVLGWQRTLTELEEDRTRQWNHALALARSDLAQVAAARAGAGREMLEAPAIGPEDLAALAGYRRGLAAREEAKRQQAQDCEQRLAEQRRRWAEARRRCRLLEKLKERRRAEHAMLQAREFDAAATEQFLARWQR